MIEMTPLIPIILTKAEKIEADVAEIKLSVIENTADLKYHIKRTDELQTTVENLRQLVSPLHQEFISKRAIEDFKKQQKEELIYKLKLPGYILAALAAIGTMIAWLGRK